MADAEEFEVEAIVEERVHNGRIQYCIKWKGWGAEYNSWEPEECLTNCSRVLTKWKKNAYLECTPSNQSVRSTSSNLQALAHRTPPLSSVGLRRQQVEAPSQFPQDDRTLSKPITQQKSSASVPKRSRDEASLTTPARSVQPARRGENAPERVQID
ncbi:hypothetical protein AB1Y20_019160 [Prymnesium parvum]|uniref:Chromo domain-containing protein n=1 Tax=Prymnesium parvum TaxID=97485 RepID=A0AB34JTB4_PRYPA